jgi:hypothetical protein
MTECLQPLGLPIEWTCDVAHALACGLESAQGSLDLLGQLRGLLQSRVQHVNLGARFFVSRMATVGETNRHGCYRELCEDVSPGPWRLLGGGGHHDGNPPGELQCGVREMTLTLTWQGVFQGLAVGCRQTDTLMDFRPSEDHPKTVNLQTEQGEDIYVSRT